jgi:phosphoribosyl-AMP cyclohydrolase
VSKQEFLPTQDEPEKIELELDDAKSESSEEEEAEEEEEEPHTPVLRRSVRDRRQPKRYNPPGFHSNFALSIIDDDPRTVREAVNSEDSKL